MLVGVKILTAGNNRFQRSRLACIENSPVFVAPLFHWFCSKCTEVLAVMKWEDTFIFHSNTISTLYKLMRCQHFQSSMCWTCLGWGCLTELQSRCIKVAESFKTLLFNRCCDLILSNYKVWVDERRGLGWQSLSDQRCSCLCLAAALEWVCLVLLVEGVA